MLSTTAAVSRRTSSLWISRISSTTRANSTIAKSKSTTRRVLGNNTDIVTSQQQLQQQQQRGFAAAMKGGTRGARGHGWFLKYRQGLGGRHLQGKFWDRDIEFLEDWNQQILDLGSKQAFINVRVGSASASSSKHDDDHDTTKATTTTKEKEEDEFQLLVDLATEALPETTQNFIQLGLDGYYTNTTIYRIEKTTGFACGDVQHLHGKGGHCHPDLGTYGVLKMEPMVMRHTRGVITMLCPGVDRVDSRFFCVTHDAPQLDGYHVPFGKLTDESLQILDEWHKNIFTKRGKPTVDMTITQIGLVNEEQSGQNAA